MSARHVGGEVLVKTGGSLTLLTVIVNDWSTLTVPSFARKVTVVFPTLSFVGVPESVVPSQFNHVGPWELESWRVIVTVSPTSTAGAGGVLVYSGCSSG